MQAVLHFYTFAAFLLYIRKKNFSCMAYGLVAQFPQPSRCPFSHWPRALTRSPFADIPSRYMYADVKQLMKVVDANPEKGTVKSSLAMAAISSSLTIFVHGNFLILPYIGIPA